MLSKSRLAQILIMLCILIGLFIYRTLNLSALEAPKKAINKDFAMISSDLCDFTQPCTYQSPLGNFNLSVEGGEITPEQWFHLTLESKAQGWKVNQANIIGKTMFMGKIPIRFSTVNQSGHLFQSNAKSMLGACTEDKMLWRIEIQVEANGKIFPLYYDFMIIK